MAGSCNGLPAVDLQQRSGRVHCVAVIDDSLNFPRGVIEWDSDLIVADKISNLTQRSLGSHIGRIYRYTKTATGFDRETLLTGLDNPSAIVRGQSPADKHLIYIATPGQILRFDPNSKQPATTVEVVIADLPTHGWHYLTGVLARHNELLVVLPSATDHCERAYRDPRPPQYPCPELTETAAVRRYRVHPDGTIDPTFELYAQGLRDALALAFDSATGVLLAADNGWDDIDLTTSIYNDVDHPADEINLLRKGLHYGWPYCFGDGSLTPGYENVGLNCADYAKPVVVLPAHSAPLAMLFFNNHLIVNLHGYRETGRRTLLYDLDQQGLPTGQPETLLNWRFPLHEEHPGGRPFGLARYGNNQFIITDDWNHALLLVTLNSES